MGGKGDKLGCVDCGPGLAFDEKEMLLVSGTLVKLVGLEKIMEEVRRLKIGQRKQVADELLSRAKKENQIPPGQEKEYRNALMDDYDRRYLTIM
ncbi:MAG: hypothetical protein NT131_07645 [Methanomassiliicoccales archaeon]|nr:hypothetical protein [Methanomassiliicoccales archaeon]